MFGRRTRCCLVVVMLIIVAALTVQAEASVTTIRYAFWGNPTAIGVERDIIDAFEAANPDIKVIPQAVGYGDYHTNLLTQIAGGMAADVMRIDSYFFVDFIKTNALMDITDLIARDGLDMDLYYEAGLVDSMHGDRFYGLPWGTAPLYMFLNVSMFEAAGIPLPDPDWTWDDFVEIIHAMAQGEGANRQYGFGSSFDMVALLPFIWGEGGNLFDESGNQFTFTNPEAIAVIDQIAGMIQDGLLPDPANFAAGDVLSRWMINDAIAMRMGSAQEILANQQVEDFVFTLLPMPGGSKVKNTTVYKSNTVAISASTRETEAAWRFLKFLRGPDLEGEFLYMEANRIPPTFNVPELWDVFADPTKHPRNVVEMSQLIASDYGHPLPLRPGWNEFSGIINPQLQRVFSGQMDAQEAMDQIAPRVQEVIERTN